MIRPRTLPQPPNQQPRLNRLNTEKRTNRWPLRRNRKGLKLRRLLPSPGQPRSNNRSKPSDGRSKLPVTGAPACDWLQATNC